LTRSGGVTARRTAARRLPAALRREQLLDATLDIIVEHGYRAVSMESIARAAGVTKPVVYDRFGSLDGLLRALLGREEQRALGAVATAMLPPAHSEATDPDALLVDGMVRVLRAIQADDRAWRLILLPVDGTPLAVRTQVERGRRLLRAHLERLVAWSLRRRGGPDLDVELAARTLLALGEDAARLVLTRPEFPPERIGAFARTLLTALPRSRVDSPPPQCLTTEP
jgi:AcrR family transcriptional regulator